MTTHHHPTAGLHGPSRRNVLVHFSAESLPATVAEGLESAAGRTEFRPQTIDWYCGWARNAAEHVYLLLPRTMRPTLSVTTAEVTQARPAWYSVDGKVSIPSRALDDGVWLVNGNLLPTINWDAAEEAECRHQCDAVLFGPPGSATSSQYPETLVVDDSGAVVRVERHYFDSAAFTELAYGPVAFLYASGPRASQVVAHVLVHGWDLGSLNGLAEACSVQWCAAPGVLSTWHVTHEPAAASYRTHLLTDRLVSRSPRTGIKPPPADRVDGDREHGTRHASPSLEAKSNGSTSAHPPPERFSLQGSTAPSRPVGEHDPPAAGGALYPYVKRSLDFLFSLVSLIILLPFLVVVGVLVRLTSPGPVFYADRRQGLGGREFRCLKFRTMISGAASMQSTLRDLNEVDGPQFKISNDPRLTTLGRWLRRYNVDELPQLINVLIGEMSLVGPRPSPDHENQLCPGWRRTRLSVRPGITGLWQVLRRRTGDVSDFQEWIYYDVEYVRRMSLWLDVQLLLHTPLTMLAPRRVESLARSLAKRGICTKSAPMARFAEGATPR